MSNAAPRIIYTRWRYANRYDNIIALNQGLNKPKYQILRDYIIEHELGHEPGGMTLKDFKHDLKEYYFSKPPIVSKQYFQFWITHPSTWLQSSPFWITNITGEWKFWTDYMRLFGWAFTLAIIGGALWLI